MTEPPDRGPVPDLVIGGAYRCGTTSLRRLLAGHPSVFFPALAEPSYFAFDDFGRRPEHLLAEGVDPFHRRRIEDRQDYVDLFKKAKPNQLTGDCSPEYLRASGSFRRLLTQSPECRVVVTLRHPVDRLLSDWQMCRRDGVEPLSLTDALDAVERRRAAGQFGGHYEATSRYADQLVELINDVPADQRLILIHEEWTRDLARTADQLTSFLGIDTFEEPPETVVHNRSGEPSNQLVAALYRLRRRLAPSLGERIPPRAKRLADDLLRRGLHHAVSNDDRQLAEYLLAGEVEAVEEVLGRAVPAWSCPPTRR